MRKPEENAAKRSRRRLLGYMQDLVIVLLLVSAVALVVESGVLSLTEQLSGDSGQAALGHSGYEAAAKPLCIVLTPDEGMHCAIIYNDEALQLGYERYSSTMAEALGSSGEPEQITQEQWEAALHGPGVYFDYYGDFQLSILAIWLGTEMSGEASGHTARRLCLAVEDESVYLYYIRERGEGGCYRCQTAVPAAELSGRISESMPNGAEYNFELESPYKDIDRCMIILNDELTIEAAGAANSLLAANTDSIMAKLGMNSYLALSYPESDGGTVKIEGEATLKLGADGELRYTRRVLDDEEPSRLSPSDAIELARQLVQDTVGAAAGDAELWLSYMYYDRETQQYTLNFDYVLGGVPVSISGRDSAVELTVYGNSVVSATMLFRSYELLGRNESPSPYPSLIAATLVQSQGGGEPRLCYVDRPEGVSSEWRIV